MILLSFWDPAEHLILLTEFLLLEKVQEEGWLHQVHTLDKHATKQKNNKIIVKKEGYSHKSNIRNGNIVYISQVLDREKNFVKKNESQLSQTHIGLWILLGEEKGGALSLPPPSPFPAPLLFCRSAGHYKNATIRQNKSQV